MVQYLKEKEKRCDVLDICDRKTENEGPNHAKNEFEVAVDDV